MSNMIEKTKIILKYLLRRPQDLSKKVKILLNYTCLLNGVEDTIQIEFISIV
jgi:hypothetical protein